MVSNFVYARPAILDMNNLTLDFQCLRAVNCEGVSEDTCYNLVIKYIDPDFIINNFASLGNMPKEDDDQTFDCQSMELTIPYILVGTTAYRVKLKYHNENGRITIESVGTVENNNNNNQNNNNQELVGNCYFNTAELTRQNFCITYYGEQSKSQAENVCNSLGGSWTSNERCDTGDLGTCTNLNDNGILTDVDYYDAGIIDMAHLAGQDASFIIGNLMEDCDKRHGVWFDYVK